MNRASFALTMLVATALAVANGINPFDRLGAVKALHLPKPKAELTEAEQRAGYKVLVRGNPADREIALTFDDGPHFAKTLQLLEELRLLQVPATFFVVGKMAALQPGVLQEIARYGNLVENHTFNHPCLDAMSYMQVRNEYLACSQVIHRATGRWPAFCRPPGGDFDPLVLKAASDLGLTTALWTDDPGDFNRIPPTQIVKRVVATARPGGIILLHDGLPETMAALPSIVAQLRAKGYRFVRLDHMAAHRRMQA